MVYKVIIQGENLVGTQTNPFNICCFCESNNWHWQLQAPQMPYTNTLDLMVFPSMPNHHLELLSSHLNMVTKSDMISQAAQEVWDSIESAKFASGYLLVYCIVNKSLNTREKISFMVDIIIWRHRLIRIKQKLGLFQLNTF